MSMPMTSWPSSRQAGGHDEPDVSAADDGDPTCRRRPDWASRAVTGSESRDLVNWHCSPTVHPDALPTVRCDGLVACQRDVATRLSRRHPLRAAPVPSRADAAQDGDLNGSLTWHEGQAPERPRGWHCPSSATARRSAQPKSGALRQSNVQLRVLPQADGSRTVGVDVGVGRWRLGSVTCVSLGPGPAFAFAFALHGFLFAFWFALAWRSGSLRWPRFWFPFAAGVRVGLPRRHSRCRSRCAGVPLLALASVPVLVSLLRSGSRLRSGFSLAFWFSLALVVAAGRRAGLARGVGLAVPACHEGRTPTSRWRGRGARGGGLARTSGLPVPCRWARTRPSCRRSCWLLSLGAAAGRAAGLARRRSSPSGHCLRLGLAVGCRLRFLAGVLVAFSFGGGRCRTDRGRRSQAAGRWTVAAHSRLAPRRAVHASPPRSWPDPPARSPVRNLDPRCVPLGRDVSSAATETADAQGVVADGGAADLGDDPRDSGDGCHATGARRGDDPQRRRPGPACARPSNGSRAEGRPGARRTPPRHIPGPESARRAAKKRRGACRPGFFGDTA